MDVAHNIFLRILQIIEFIKQVGEKGYNASYAELFIAFLQQVLNLLIQEHEFKILFYM